MEHRRKYERKREEKEIKERQERIKKAREEHARAQRVSCWRGFLFQAENFSNQPLKLDRYKVLWTYKIM